MASPQMMRMFGCFVAMAAYLPLGSRSLPFPRRLRVRWPAEATPFGSGVDKPISLSDWSLRAQRVASSRPETGGPFGRARSRADRRAPIRLHGPPQLVHGAPKIADGAAGTRKSLCRRGPQGPEVLGLGAICNLRSPTQRAWGEHGRGRSGTHRR